ncbi:MULTISPECIES: tRNA epoxyqueuosine(34) reductase QueG [unclassified Mesorhizobium]|uniref:tRNA epoxyqueuosine(34) reductase QueG n=2 Tax=Mesorhizobium TaxID=68287 RepID=UPI000BAEB4AC|nr:MULTISPECIES: tRNA epoxyqueuosine(34) reductase QueG [unclassified Mesorhizobium]TGT60413.1 tRNA epoxyqueuosine(34) reductase QueG [Mesorhizobium sp. M00.F.Ca.ET.170.01.1.1]AZO10480.1 tRNA epoxyqueuosine(34) reductase QueG [Mesorhizobium sp. M3A.F.Ca.ET.080.04.2.1]PBB88005.1 tRNA epoxyqueuosine(34) reductase QueG [Mesorhizobium sp. WSM3876]RWB69138.1 MAG: tRNA epoxyqueuosine(34) reductase QueG [Mesorhizobium sp.]RWB84213.1 MAG: tRNA epoxyqueuosine(34) reductase QueG [Mesorhizobium sp.]
MRTSISSRAKLRALIDAEARRAGFEAIAVTTPDAIPMAPARLAEFVADGFHGSMGWIAETIERRAEPSTLWPEVRSIIVLAMNYGPDHDPRDVLGRRDRGAISVYAQNRDYHDVMKGRLKEIAGKIVARAGGDVKVFVDTAPVMEKPLAEAAGLGWQGKHTNLVSRAHGSWLFLGTIFTTADLEPDAAEEDHCGSCRACLDACPTGAFPAPYRLDARRCISYLTIENKGPIPHEFREAIGNRIYGCDDCLAACPWNKFASAASDAKLAARTDLREPPLSELLKLDDPGFRAFFSGSPIKRIGRDRFIRNVLIAAGNSGDTSLTPAVQSLLEDGSPLVRGAAVWALSRLLSNRDFRDLATAVLQTEGDPAVRDEWFSALPDRAELH